MQVQLDRRVLVRAAIEHATDQPRLERGEELQRLQGGLALPQQAIGLGLPGTEQALVFGQGFLDLAIARQGGVFEDAQPLGGLELGLVEVADAVLGHQPGGFVRKPVAALAQTGFSVLACMMHVSRPLSFAGTLAHLGVRRVSARAGPRRHGAAVQKMS